MQVPLLSKLIMRSVIPRKGDTKDQERLGIEPTETLRNELLFLRTFGAVHGIADAMRSSPLHERLHQSFLEMLAGVGDRVMPRGVIVMDEDLNWPDRKTFQSALADRLIAYGRAYNTEGVPDNWDDQIILRDFMLGYGEWRVGCKFSEYCGLGVPTRGELHSESQILSGYGSVELTVTKRTVWDAVSRFKAVVP